MPKGLVNESSLNSIAEAINVLNGTEGTYAPSEMGEAIIDAIRTETVEGNPIHITDAAAYPAESVVTTLEPVQEGSGDPSPENVRPITGHTGVELTRVGKNLVEKAYVSPLSWNGLTITENADGSIKITGKATYTAATGLYALSLQNESTYLFHTGGTDAANYLMVRRNGNPGIINGGQFTAHAGSTYDVAIRTAANAEIDMTLFPVVSLLANTETHSVTFPQEQNPVYGCEVDWVNGVLRVTKINVDLGTLTWSYQSVYTRFVANVSNIKFVPGDYTSGLWSSCYQVDASPIRSTRIDCTLAKHEQSIYVNNFSYTDAETFKAAMTGQQLVYELATPIEIPLTSEIITLLKGENNVWTDSGTSEIEYKVDLNAYIQKLIDEASASASALNVSSLSLGKSVVELESETEASKDVESADEESEALTR